MGKLPPRQKDLSASAQMEKFYEKVERNAISKRTKKVYVPEDNPRKFEKHLEHREPPNGFRFRPSTKNNSLLARRSVTNAVQLAASSSGSLVPTYKNFVDLCTPSPSLGKNTSNTIDSGYISGPNHSASPPRYGSSSPASGSNVFVGLASQDSESIPITGDPTNLPEYRTTMEQTTEQLFFRKFVCKNFTHNPREALKQLQPIMRQALDKMEDRPMVDRYLLILNFKKGTIRGEKRRERWRHKPGTRAFDWRSASWESDSYMTAR